MSPYGVEQLRDYRVGERAFRSGRPRSACTSAAMREGWSDAYQVAACAAVSQPSSVAQ